MSCPTCGRPGTVRVLVSGAWRDGDEHADWCEDVRRRHHDDDVRAVSKVGHAPFSVAGVRDFERWGWLTAEQERGR